MQLNHHEKIRQVFPDVLENLAFMFAEQSQIVDMPTELDQPIHVRIDFAGASRGQLHLITSQEVCDEIAINLLGYLDASELQPGSADDAIKELANITCGQFLTAAAGTQPVFNLTPPQLITSSDNTWASMLNDADSFLFTIDQTPIILNIKTAA